MPLNNYFNLKRFALLLRQDLLINRTRYLLGLVILGLVVYIFSYLELIGKQRDILFFYVDPKQNEMYKYFNVVRIYSDIFTYYLFAIATIIGTAFPDLSDKIKTSKFLLNPGSTFEKFLVQFLIRVVYFLPLALGIFWIAIRLAKWSLTPLEEGIMEGVDPAIIPYFHFKDLFTDHWENKVWQTHKIFFICFGLFSYGIYLFAGSTYFKRFALVKTVITSVIILFLPISFAVLLSHIFYPQQTKGFDLKLEEFPVTEYLSSSELSLLLLSLLSWMFFLAIGYFKLKEKEI